MLYYAILLYSMLYYVILFYGIIISTIGILLGCPVPYLWWDSMPWHWADETNHLWAFQSIVVCCGGLQIMQHQNNNLLVLSREWMGMGEWDDYYYSDYGSFPHSLLSTSKTISGILRVIQKRDTWQGKQYLEFGKINGETGRKRAYNIRADLGPKHHSDSTYYTMHRWRAHSIEPLVHRSKSSCFWAGCSSPHQPIWIHSKNSPTSNKVE